MDVIFASLLVILLISTIASISNAPASSDITLQLDAKDATFAWFFSGVVSNPVIVPPQEYACDFGFRPTVTTQLLLPNLSSSWVKQVNCVVRET